MLAVAMFLGGDDHRRDRPESRRGSARARRAGPSRELPPVRHGFQGDAPRAPLEGDGGRAVAGGRLREPGPRRVERSPPRRISARIARRAR